MPPAVVERDQTQVATIGSEREGVRELAHARGAARAVNAGGDRVRAGPELYRLDRQINRAAPRRHLQVLTVVARAEARAVDPVGAVNVDCEVRALEPTIGFIPKADREALTRTEQLGRRAGPVEHLDVADTKVGVRRR